MRNRGAKGFLSILLCCLAAVACETQESGTPTDQVSKSASASPVAPGRPPEIEPKVVRLDSDNLPTGTNLQLGDRMLFDEGVMDIGLNSRHRLAKDTLWIIEVPTGECLRLPAGRGQAASGADP
jgi:hypothetical protein